MRVFPGQCRSLRIVVILLVTLASGATPAADDAPLKVFILAGQSNMQGHGHVRTIDWLGEDEQHGGLLEKIKTSEGEYVERDDVWIHYQRNPGTLKAGNLTVGYGANDETIGPELMFGQIVGDHFEEQVLLIKTAWGGKSLADDFRPPSSEGDTGPNYTEMLAIIDEALSNLEQHFPEYNGQGYELAGFVWFQGWNDMINADRVAVYEVNMINLIRDLRNDLNAPDLPVVIGELGVGGAASAVSNQRMADIRVAQAAPTRLPEFEGTVACVATSEFWDDQAHEFLDAHWVRRQWDSEENMAIYQRMGSQPPYHYLGSARIYSLIGYGFAQAMIELSATAE